MTTKFRLLAVLILGVLVFASCLNDIEKVPMELPENAVPVPNGIEAKASDGSVTLTWYRTEGAISYRIHRSDDLNGTERMVAETKDTSYTDSGLINGRTYFYSVSAVGIDGLEGEKSDKIDVIPSIYSLIINSGEKFTNSKEISITVTAPATTEYMIFSNDSLFEDSSWEGYSNYKVWRLTENDGEKTVYARFMDSDGFVSPIISADITLDTYAAIQSLAFQPDTVPVQGSIHFKLICEGNETYGRASVTLKDFNITINLFDNGKNGDEYADDGIYEVDYHFTSDVRGRDISVRGHFTDEAGNIANEFEPTEKLSFTDVPEQIELIGSIDSTTSSITIKWEQSNDEHFRSYRIYRDTIPGVSESSEIFIKELSNILQTTYPDGSLREGRTYYYRIFVVNDLLETAGSNEVALSTFDAYPTPAVLDTVSSIGANRLTLTWSENQNTDFREYRIYRATSPGVTESSTLVKTISNREQTYYDDEGIDTVSNVYYYRIYTYDDSGKFSRSNEVSTND